MNHGLRWIGFWLMLHTVPLMGAELPQGFQFHGFASQYYTWTSANNFFGNSSGGGVFAPTELGVNASWLALNNLQLSGQLLFRRAGETDPGDLKLDYGLVDYTLLSDEVNRWGLRLGRVKIPAGFYNETRDVPFTKPSILLPQSIYPEKVRSLALSADGLNLYGERRSDYGDLFLQAGAGYPQAVDRELEQAVFGVQVPGGFERKASYLSRLLYDWKGGRLRAAVSYFQANLDYDPGIVSPFAIPAGSLRIEPWIFSLQYNAERWSLTTEYTSRRVHTQFGQLENQEPQEGYYIQGTYRFTENWEGILRYDVLYADKNDKDGEKFAARDLLRRPAFSRFARDWTIGLRWHVTPQLLLNAEYHRVNGTAWLPELDNPVPSDTRQYWDMLLFMAAYRF
jgi:hypothetical protein